MSTTHQAAAATPATTKRLACTICLEHYTAEGDHVPRLLPCAHTLCSKCVAAMQAELKDDKQGKRPAKAPNTPNSSKPGESAGLVCPFCRQGCGTGDVGANDAVISVLPSTTDDDDGASHVSNQQQQQAASTKCGNCEDGHERAAAVRCAVCNVDFCSLCFDATHASKAFKSHAKVSLSEVSSVMCATHSRPLELFCLTCTRAVCLECGLSLCKQHEFAKIHEAVESATRELEARARGLGEWRAGLKDRVQQCEQAIKANDTAKATALAAVRTAMTRLAESVATLRAELEAQVEAVFASSMKQVGLHKEQLETMLEGVRSMVLSCERLMRERQSMQQQQQQGGGGVVGQVRRYVERAWAVGVHGESLMGQCEGLCNVGVSSLEAQPFAGDVVQRHMWHKTSQQSMQHVQSSIDALITHATSLHASYCKQQQAWTEGTGEAARRINGQPTHPATVPAIPLQQLLTTPLPRPLPADFIPAHLPSLIAHWLNDGCRTTPAVRLQLLYRASRDGFGARDFHAKCDNKGATVTVITSSEGYVFGGYADQSWTSDNKTVESTSAFLFSLVCASCDVATKLSLNGQCNDWAMICHSGWGPVFGHWLGCDIYVADSANTNTESYTCLGSSYTLPPGMDGDTYFTGSENFRAREVKVYQVIIT